MKWKNIFYSSLITILVYFIPDNNVKSDVDTVNDEETSTTTEVKMFSEANANSSTESDRFVGSNGIPFTPKSRKKRSLSSENVVELMIVADKKMADYHGEELHSYILTLMSIVSARAAFEILYV